MVTSLFGIVNDHLLLPRLVMVSAGLVVGAFAFHPVSGLAVYIMVSPAAAVVLLRL